MNFYESFISLCNKVGKTPSRVVLEIGLSKPTVNRWKNGSTPTDATAMKVAEYFGVSVQDLIGESTVGDIAYEVCRDNGLVESPFKKEESTVAADDGLSESHMQLLELVKDLTEEQARMMLRQGELLLLLMEKQKRDSER